MDRKTLEAFGLDKEVIDKVLDAHSADIGKHKKQIEDLTGERDTLKSQADEVAAKLKAFDGVDVAAFKGEIEKLKGDMAAKEADFAAKIADRDFTDLLHAEITAAKGKNPKAVMALLDIEKLKGSKNQKEDAAAAVKAIAESDAYLFGGESKPTPAKFKTAGEHHEPSGDSSDAFTAAAREAAGLNNKKE